MNKRITAFRLAALGALLLAGCGPPPGTKPGPQAGGLPAAGRIWVARCGRPAATSRMAAALAARDESHGAFERLLGKARADKPKIWPGTLAALPRAERSRTGVFLVLGFQKRTGRSAPIIRAAAAWLVKMGYHAEVIESGDRQTAAAGGRLIAETLAAELPGLHRAVVVGFSKGSADLTEFWLGPARGLAAAQRQKILIWVNCAGVLQGSQVARWLAYGNDWRAALARAFVNLRTLTPFSPSDDLASIAGTPWQLPEKRLPPGTTGHLLCVDMAVLPDGADGWPTTDRLFRWFGQSAAAGGLDIGPCDGLVESAAAVLPDGTGLREWVVRIHGSHALLDGWHVNGMAVAPSFSRRGNGQLASGIELLEDVIRVLPADP